MFKRIIYWLLVIMWMILIYKFSAETGEVSAGKSQAITKSINYLISKTPFEYKIHWTDHATRKTGHVVEYLVLAMLIINALSNSGAEGVSNIAATILISVAYASMDEFHQSFSVNRGPSVKDVLIDSIGIFIAVILYILKTKYIKFKRA